MTYYVHSLYEVSHVRGSVFDERDVRWVVTPLPLVLDVEHIVAEPEEPERILEVVPEDAAEGVRGGEPGDGDAERRRHPIVRAGQAATDPAPLCGASPVRQTWSTSGIIATAGRPRWRRRARLSGARP